MNENFRFIEILDRLKAAGRLTDYVQAASVLGTNKAGISDIKSGRKKLSLEILRRLKNSYHDISLDWIIIGSGTPFIIDEPQIEPAQSIAPDAFIQKIAEQAEEIGRLKQENEQLRREKGKNASGARTSEIANAG